MLTNTIAFHREEIEGSITARFRHIVEAVGSQTAIVSGPRTLTYRELDSMSTKVAAAILSRNAGSNPIPLICGSDERTIIALLGVLKSGHPYVLLDHRSPADRNRRILKGIDATVMIYSRAHGEHAPAIAGDGLNALEIDSVLMEDSHANIDDLPASTPDDLAYIVFTSGTTGTPKGVMQTHRNVLHRAWSYATTARLIPQDKLALLYSPTASGSVRDVYGGLLAGGSLHMYDLPNRGFDQLGDWVRAEGITVYNSAATVFRHFAATIRNKTDLPTLRLVQLGSETIYRSDVELYKARFPDSCEFVARLGSSEISPICKFYVDKETSINYPTVPAGYPVDDVHVSIVDEEERPVPAGTTGEIVVTSRYLTPGYWMDPDASALALEACADDPLAKRFRTGDLGMITADGLLVHMGRKDFQIKISGFRVEPTEIEAALLDLGTLREAAVVADRQDDKWRLVAYVTAEEGVEITESALRSALLKRLPRYMIPTRFGILESLPTTSSGKVDRLALPSIPDKEPVDFVAPKTEFEKQVARVLSDVLSVEQVSVRDSFVDLGGTSLAAMQIASRLSTIYGFRLPLQTFFGEESVAGIAEKLEAVSLLDGASDVRAATDSTSDFEEGAI